MTSYKLIVQIVQAVLGEHMSVSRLNHWLPGCETHPAVMQGTVECPEQIVDARLPQAAPVFHNATALHAPIDLLDALPAMMSGLVGQLLLQGELLAPGLLRRYEAST
jgi:hypothetical protein